MLDKETKDRINTARDILVGKMPDPKSQVEQITIALIYKFMDDMDAESEELGGKRKFFTGKYAKYGWRKIFNPKLGGHEMLQLYSDAIQQMNLIPTVPQLFRDIFKNAYLPYRDPETLKSFLKIINEFHYDHSEKLGDAFEYLLSVLGSQGDAGQFRTPRHIIDFIVRLVDPKKNEKILDPACGTAGFLISAYKHIVTQNTHPSPVGEGKGVRSKPGNALTPADKKNLADNFRGYDISPDMVRMSLANMYLHGFAQPNIYEYDTLTSEDRWNEYYDVILANPPFMSPKGGIRPHKRFSVQSNRSEVLFVDYIAEHLSPNGRAAIIVPEGIIFQSGNAYKQLRKMLVEEYLVAVVSLPAGVFNPYSGVKTSVLVMDKTLAKKTKDILFVKISNDGFDLGAQRREIDKNDLHDAEILIREYMASIAPTFMPEKKNTNKQGFGPTPLTSIVAKKKIAANGEYNFSGDRYKENEENNTIHRIVSIGEICETTSGGTPLRNKPEYYEGGTIPWLKSGEVAQGCVYHAEEFITNEGLKNSSAKLLPVNTVLVAMYGATAGEVGILKFEASSNQAVCGILPNEKILPEYLFWILKSRKEDLIKFASGGAQPNISQKIIKDYSIPLPPLSIQQQIVSEIEVYQKVIDGAKQVVENYKPVIHINPEWEMVELGEVCEKVSDGIDPQQQNGNVAYIGLENIESNSGSLTGEYISSYQEIKSTKTKFQQGDVLYGKLRPNLNKVWYAEFDGICSTDIFVLRFNDKALSKLFSYYLRDEKFNQEVLKGLKGAQLPRVGFDHFSSLLIPLPSLEEQHYIVQQLETEKQLVENNKQLIELMQAKINAAIARVWGSEKREEQQHSNKTSAKTKKMYEENEEVSLVAEE